MSIKYNGHEFRVGVRYVEGHKLTAAEASKLQRVYERELKPGLHDIVEDGLANNLSVQAMEDAFFNLAASYQFTIRRPGGPSRKPKDPVAMLALQNATRDVREELRKIGAKGVKLGVINKRAREWVATAALGYMEDAKRQLAKSKSRNLDVSDLLS